MPSKRPANYRPTVTVRRLDEEIAQLKDALHRLVLGTTPDMRDHMTSCDRVMGDTHPCTCGANAARELLGRLYGD